MPKREPTPPLDDDLKYFVVNYPYPLHADMKIPEERETFAKWIACCIGQDYLFAIYHKPSAQNMVIIEVAKNCPNVNKYLLGAHKWREFLKKPEADQMELESRVYYCHHARSREVQKHGWKRIDVHDRWFKNWSPETSEFVTTPYPSTRYCDLPAESQTGQPLCRPLPQSVFPKPKQDTPPVPVGSNVWIASKMTGVPIGPQQVKRAPTKKNESPASIDVAVRWPSNSSTASSEVSPSLSPGPAVSRTASTLPAPPGLGPPPGIAAPTPQKANLQAALEVLASPSPESQVQSPDSSDDWGVPMPMASAVVSISEADSVDVSNLSIGGTDDPNSEDPEQYWAQQGPWKVDWDKQICPVHKQACKPGICKDMAKLERQKKKEEEAKERANARRQAANPTQRRFDKAENDGWSVAGSGSGRGARGGGRGRGESHIRGTRGGASDRVGRGGVTDRGGRGAWGVVADRGGRGGTTSDRGRGGAWADRGAWGGTSDRGGRGGPANAWGGRGESMAAHLQRTTSAPRGGRGEWTRGGSGERARGRGRGQTQIQAQEEPVRTKSATESGGSWAKVGAEWSEVSTPWDDDQGREEQTKADAPSDENSWTEVRNRHKGERTPWDKDEGPSNAGTSSAWDADAWPEPGQSSGPSAWDMDSWGGENASASQGANDRGQGPSSDPWAGRRGGPW